MIHRIPVVFYGNYCRAITTIQMNILNTIPSGYSTKTKSDYFINSKEVLKSSFRTIKALN